MNDAGRPRGAIAWMAANPVASNLVMVLLLLGGTLFALGIKQEIFPEFDLDRVSITVPYPGASPEEVEQGIVLAVEEAVRGLDGIEKVTSTAGEGSASVMVELQLGTDGQKATSDIQQAVDRLTTLPEDAEEPQVTYQTRRNQVLSVVVSGATDEASLRHAADEVRLRLLSHPAITQADLRSPRPREIAVEIPAATLRDHDLTLDAVAARLRQSAVEMPGGAVKSSGGEVLLRVKDRRDLGGEFAEIPVLTGAGSTVRLGQVATVRDGFADDDTGSTYDGRPALLVDVYRVGRQKPLEVAEAVRAVLDATRLPAGIRAEIRNDFSDLFASRMDLMLKNAWMGFILVVGFLLLFLAPRLAFWVSMSIPISFLGAFWLLPHLGVTINMVSMFAFIVAIGIVVDDAVVVGENTYEYRTRRGLAPLDAATQGARDVSMPVTFSILTNLVTFLPLMFLPGVMGKIFWVIPVVVNVVFIVSLFDCLLIMPARLGNPMRFGDRLAATAWGSAVCRAQRAFSGGLASTLERLYHRVIEPCLHHRYLSLAVMVAVLLATVGWVRGGHIRIIDMPRVEADVAVASLRLPFGVDPAATRAVRDRLEQAARSLGEAIQAETGRRQVLGIYTEVGSAGGGGGFFGGASETGAHLANLQVFLAPPEERPVTTQAFVDRWRQAVGQVPGVETLTFAADSGGPGAGAGMTIQLVHADMDELKRSGADLAEALAVFPMLKDIDDGFTPGKRQLDFRLRDEARRLGLTSAEVGRQLRNAFFGAEVLRQQRGRDEVKVVVRLPRAEREQERSIEALRIRTPAGSDVPLAEVCDLAVGTSYTRITRVDGRRAINVTADVQPLDKMGEVVAAVQQEGGLIAGVTARHPGLGWSFEGRQADMRKSNTAMLQGFLVALLGIYVLLAIPLRSYLQPVFIMVAIPFGIIGAIAGHQVMGYPMSTMSWMGVVALGGVAVNASLLMLVYTGELRAQGLDARQAITAAGARRLRPILLTTMTTFLGLLPMIFETSRQARFLIPMAISLGFGILIATVISLLIVPCLYMALDDLRRWWRGDDQASNRA